MNDERVLNTDSSQLDFLYNRISMPRVCMAAWLRVPEFFEKIRDLDSNGIKITDAIVLEVAQPILSEKILDRKNNRDLRLPTLKRGLKHLQNNLGTEQRV